MSKGCGVEKWRVLAGHTYVFSALNFIHFLILLLVPPLRLIIYRLCYEIELIVFLT